MKPETVKALKELHAERIKLAQRKNNDYGSAIDNIGTLGLPGIACRCWDKACRLASLVLGGVKAKVVESVEDTLMDMANYADFGILLIRKKWKN